MKKLLMLTLFLFFNLSPVLFGQEESSYDVILKLNGEEHVGSVKEMDDASIKFTHKNESLTYTFKRSDVMKITFASGRIEIINEVPDSTGQNSSEASSLESHHNKIAILPFSFLIGKQRASEEMNYKVQSECFTFLSRHVGELIILDPVTTNALLIKAGITLENMRGYTMGEICNVLGVEYLISGTITQNQTSSTTYQGTSTSGQSGKSKNKLGNIFSATSSSYSSSSQNYQTSMTMNIYTDKNTNIFSKDHTSFWQIEDAYKITLQYMLKQTPIYKK
jgi:hypothetical protein